MIKLFYYKINLNPIRNCDIKNTIKKQKILYLFLNARATNVV